MQTGQEVSIHVYLTPQPTEALGWGFHGKFRIRGFERSPYFKLFGGGDGLMDIETGVYTVLTSGYYIITYSASAVAYTEESTHMFIRVNNGYLSETTWESHLGYGSANQIYDQGSRTTVGYWLNHLYHFLLQYRLLQAGDTVDLMTSYLGHQGVYRITFCIYLTPIPYSA